METFWLATQGVTLVTVVRKEDKGEFEALARGEHGDPFSLLGPHRIANPGRGPRWVIRGLFPGAQRVELKLAGELYPMSELVQGVFQAKVREAPSEPGYRFVVHGADGKAVQRLDSYAFRELLSDFDLHLLGEGNHFHSYRKLGSHVETRGNTRGTRFAVWAPNAASVCLAGDFNGWSRTSHPMQLHSGTGIWQLFVPEAEAGTFYKYMVRTRAGQVLEKIDPYGFFYEVPPRTATVVYDIGDYSWSDEEWMEARRRTNLLHRPVSIYEVHLGSWRRLLGEGDRPLNYRELAESLVPYVREMGFTHIELMPVTEHPYGGSWGYQTTGYFAPTSRFGTPDDFRFFVDTCHRNGIGVLLDWVPAHFPRDMHALAYFDGTHLYEHEDPRKGAHPDWGTLIFNYGRNEVRNFLLSSALFWLDEYHLDGLRVDAVASMLYLDYSRKDGEWVANPYGGKENLEAIDFLKRFNELVHEFHPGAVTFAEESTAWPAVSRPTYLGGLGFTMKWNMGWMHDSLAYISQDPVYRKYHHDKLTFSMLYAFSENFVLPLSHDEVVHGKGALLSKVPGDGWQKFANLRVYFTYQFGHPGKKLLFMGGEFGQWNEWNYESCLDWHLLQWESHRSLQAFVKELNRLYRTEASLYEVDFDWQGFEWIDFRDQDQSIVSFIRRAHDPRDFLAFVFNFTPVPRYGYRLGVPEPGYYPEVLNSDASCWGGSNMGNLGGAVAEKKTMHGHPFSVTLTLPPLAALVLKAPADRPDQGQDERCLELNPGPDSSGASLGRNQDRKKTVRPARTTRRKKS